MDRIKLIIPLLLLLCMDAYPQNISGRVYDNSTKLPIANASIFLNGTSYSTKTNKSGEFYLKVARKMNTKLIISHLSYEIIEIENPFENESMEIFLNERDYLLDEITIKPSRFSRNKLFNAFEQQFLGADKAGKSCTIVNKEDIRLNFNEEEGILYASNERPIIIENKYLGYQMHCLITDFQVRYEHNNSIDSRNIKSVLLRCNSFFMDASPNNPVVKKRREETYKGSLNYFFKNFVEKTLDSSKHLVYNHSLAASLMKVENILIKPYEYFNITSKEYQKIIRIKPYTDIYNPTELELPYPVSRLITVVNSSKRPTKIYFLTDELSVDAFGIIDKKDYVYISGQMGEQRMGSTLPLDFEITPTVPEQDIQDIPTRLVSLFEKQLEIFPQVKIYVHTDKPYYISGEKIWFRAYLANAVNHEPVPVSRYVYVELINPFNAVIARVKILQEEGAYHGYLTIPEDAPEGDYTMRAYTALMQSQDENYFFTKTFYIGDPHARAAYKSPMSDDDFDVSFYPEGGSILQGTFCKVAFKAMKSNGLSADISGTVYDQTGKEIRSFKSDYLGMGNFPHLAEKGKSYYAVCKNEKGESKRFDLPIAVDYGYALSVSRAKDNMYVTVLKPAEITQSEELYLLAHTRGMVHFADRWDPEKNHIIQPEQFPSGVLHLILFDSGLNIVSERLVFINNQDQARVSYQTDQENYTSRSLVKNRVKLSNNDDQPLVANFSVAVTSDKEVQTDSTSNILTQLLLTSDLRGNIENPAYYFQNTTSSILALDLLMCTQGWRRYNIAEMSKGNFSRPAVSLETIPKISGIVKNDLLGTPAKNIEVTIMSLKDEYFDKTKTDKDGRFSFKGIEWPDSTSFTVSVKMKKTTTAKNLILDKESFPKRTLFALPRTGIDKDLFTQYADKAEQKYVFENGMRMINLPEVKITAQQRPLKKSHLYENPTHTITGDFISKFPAPNILYHLNTVPGVIVNFNSKRVLFPRNAGFDRSPCLIVDGALWAYAEELPEMINMISPSDIAQIDILEGPAALVFGSKAIGGAIVIFTKTDEDYKFDEYTGHIKHITPLGYQQPVEFYIPKYDTPEKRNVKDPDLRTTIHWQPIVQTNDQGEASFEFYTADEATSYTVIIEGLADDGSIIRNITILSIDSSTFFPH